MVRKPFARLVSASVVLGIVVALSVPTAATALTASNQVLMFSKAGFTDPAPGEEDQTLQASLVASGASVTVFDGGDGSDTAWIAALVGIDTLVFPEAISSDIYLPGGTAVMSDAAAAVIAAWMSGGGRVYLIGGYSKMPLMLALTGLDYSPYNNFTGSPGGLGWDLQAAAPGLPATLFDTSETYALDSFDTWPAPLADPVTPAYLSGDGTSLVVGFFSVGSGGLLYFGYDWFPVGSPPLIADWNVVLQTLGNAPAAASGSALAATGVDLTLPLLGGSAVLLAGVAILLVARRRARQG